MISCTSCKGRSNTAAGGGRHPTIKTVWIIANALGKRPRDLIVATEKQMEVGDQELEAKKGTRELKAPPTAMKTGKHLALMLHLLSAAVNPSLPLHQCLKNWHEISLALREPARTRTLKIETLRSLLEGSLS